MTKITNKRTTQKPQQWFLDYMENFRKEINDWFDNLIKKNNLKE